MDMITCSSDEFSCDEQHTTPGSPKGNQSTTTISSSTSRRKFTEEEDKLLSKLVSEMGPRKWDQIAKKMPNNRTARQCRDRYSNYLIPGFFNGEWSKEEDELLYKKYQEYGPKWAVIKEYFTNRSPNAIKNRWNYFVSRSSSIASSVNSEKNKKCEDSLNQNFVSSSQIISPPTVIHANASAPIFSLWTPGTNFIQTQQLSPVQPELFATGYSTIYGGVSCGFFTPSPSNSIQLTIPQNYQMMQNNSFGNNFNRCNVNYVNNNINTKTAPAPEKETAKAEQNSSVPSSPAQSDFEDENDTWEFEETNLFDCIENEISNDEFKLNNLCYLDTPENDIYGFY